MDGSAPNAFLVIGFDEDQGAVSWKQSETYKAFDAAAQKLATTRIFQVAALSDTLADKKNSLRTEHERALQDLVKRQDELLNRLGDICKGC
jgi:hypothetical protein